ncbi:hypothetical protein BDFG_02916 [Blastomyces dermatitidis ATCC 26199]|nr:hypothetical protein BDFG_02916 [Blastomyces dermatitidis ATCC 26199]
MATRIACPCNRASQTVILDWSPDSVMRSPSVLPFCHCDTCRRTAGLLCTSYVPLKQGKQSGPDLNGLVEYHFEPLVLRNMRCPCLSPDQGNRRLTEASSVCPSQLEGFFRAERNATHVSQELPALLQHIYTPTSWTSDQKSNESQQESPNSAPSSTKTLAASCQCEGVKFFMTAPNHTSRSPTSPWSDVLVPYHSSTPPSAAAANPNDVKWWLCDNGTKYLAGLCACNSCRLASGFPIQSWAFISRLNIFKTSDGSNLAYDDLGTLKYKSSPGVYREFCGVCGATVFWHSDERPEVVDVSVGLLRAETRVRIDDWLHWELGRISFEEHALDKGMVRFLKEGFSGVGWDPGRVDVALWIWMVRSVEYGGSLGDTFGYVMHETGEDFP